MFGSDTILSVLLQGSSRKYSGVSKRKGRVCAKFLREDNKLKLLDSFNK